VRHDHGVYAPAHFQQPDADQLVSLMRAHSFALLSCAEAEGVIEASHLPFLVEPARLRCHVARQNRLAELAAAGKTMTAVFAGPHAYVSPRWYGEPDKSVPTWNYAVVHATATARVVPEAELREMVHELTALEERGAWSPTASSEKMLRGIVGIELVAPRLVGKWKLGQNRSAEDRDRVRQALEGSGHAALAALMR
jgi:transcriptional regulator